MCTVAQRRHEAGAQDDREGEEMQAGQQVGQPFVGAGEAAEAGGPGVAARDDPAARQQHEAALGLGRLLAGVALGDEGDLDGLAGGLLHLLGQRRHLRAVLPTRGPHEQGQLRAEGADGQMRLAPLPPRAARAAARPLRAAGGTWRRGAPESGGRAGDAGATKRQGAKAPPAAAPLGHPWRRMCPPPARPAAARLPTPRAMPGAAAARGPGGGASSAPGAWRAKSRRPARDDERPADPVAGFHLVAFAVAMPARRGHPTAHHA